jgi:type IV secretion system protein VirD4
MIQLVNGIISLIASLCEGIITGISQTIVELVPSKRKEAYNADYLNVHKVLDSKEKGFCLTGDKSISIKDSFSNALVFGGSGSGKSTKILLPSLYKMAGSSSLCVHDPSGELAKNSSGYFASIGYSIAILNYAYPELSEKYNPLERVKTISDIKKLSKILITTSLGGGTKSDPFWNSAAENLVTLLIRYVLFYTNKEHHTLYNVLTLLNLFSGSPKQVDILIVQTKDDDLLSEYKSFVAYDTKMLMSIVATSKTALSLFSDPQVAEITSKDTIEFASFRAQKSILYINNDVNSMKYYSVLSSIFFEQFFASVMKQLPQKAELPIFFLLDEASSLYLSILPTTISNIRKYFSGILQVYQSQNQLMDLYGMQQGRNIIANSYSRVYMPGQPLETARELESILGKYEFVDDQNNRRMRQLASMDEIRIMDDAIILIGNKPPIKAKLVPYYEKRELRKLGEIPPYQKPTEVADETKEDETTEPIED